MDVNEYKEYRKLRKLLKRQEKIMTEHMDNLVAKVDKMTTVAEGAITVLQDLSARVAVIQAELEAEGIDNAKLDELALDLDTEADKVATAIANVPPAPPPPVARPK